MFGRDAEKLQVILQHNENNQLMCVFYNVYSMTRVKSGISCLGELWKQVRHFIHIQIIQTDLKIDFQY